MLRRMIGAAMLNGSVYEEIKADRGALAQAIAIVVLVTICGIVGDVLGSVIGDEEQSIQLVGAVLKGVLSGLLSWALWVTLLYFVGAVMLKTDNTDTNWSELGRVVGFAYTPGLLFLFSFLQGIGGVLGFIARIWILVAVVIGVRHALDYGNAERAILVSFIAGIIAAIPWLIMTIIQLTIT